MFMIPFNIQTTRTDIPILITEYAKMALDPIQYLLGKDFPVDTVTLSAITWSNLVIGPGN